MKQYQDIIEQVVDTSFPNTDRCEKDLDNDFVEKHRHEWEMISTVGQCSVLVFDCFTHKFVYASDLGLDLFGLTVNQFIDKGHAFLSELIHPEDITLLLHTRIKAYAYWQSLAPEKRSEYKLVHEFRIRDLQGKYVRLTEQEQIVALDKRGNIWLTMSVVNLDASHAAEPIKSHIYNIRTGEQIGIDLSDTLDEPLSPRETEILKPMQTGKLSKEISAALGISVNTVHVHRQNIFHKLNADNAIEAVNHAQKLGLLNR